MKNRNMIIMVIVYALIFILIGVFQPRDIDWRPTFAEDDKIPYGTYILRQRLNDLFPGAKTETSSESIYKTLHKKQFTNTNYLLIEPNINISESDMRELIHFANEGNNVFIAAQTMPYALMDTLGITSDYTEANILGKLTKTDTAQEIPVSLINPNIGKDSVFIFENTTIPLHISSLDSSYYHDEERIIDTNQIPLAKKVFVISTVYHKKPIYVKVPVGKGNIFLHTYPFAFTNFYLLKDSTRSYAENCLSYLPNGKIIWDEHYKTDMRYQHVSTLGFILRNNSLRWAYYTGMLFMILFVVFSIKRRQRIIPVVTPFRNTTLEFTETFGRLYFNRGDHKNIVEKKIKFFLEYVRSRYYMDTQNLDADFVEKLTIKSGIEKERIQYMTQLMRSLLNKQVIADTELIQLNDLIEYFKKHST